MIQGEEPPHHLGDFLATGSACPWKAARVAAGAASVEAKVAVKATWQ